MALNRSSAAEVYRPSRKLAWVMGAAGVLWLSVLAYLIFFAAVPVQTLMSTLFFVAFFGVSLVYYVRTAIIIDGSGLTYRGMVRTQRVSFEDIRKVDVLPGLITVYSVRGPGRFIHFTSFFPNHEVLASLVVERAGLMPLRE